MLSVFGSFFYCYKQRNRHFKHLAEAEMALAEVALAEAEITHHLTAPGWFFNHGNLISTEEQTRYENVGEVSTISGSCGENKKGSDKLDKLLCMK